MDDDPEDLRDPESLARWELAKLEKEYRRRAEPFIKILADIEAMKPPKPLFLTLDQIGEIGLHIPPGGV
jgi:hypothetical protein